MRINQPDVDTVRRRMRFWCNACSCADVTSKATHREVRIPYSSDELPTVEQLIADNPHPSSDSEL